MHKAEQEPASGSDATQLICSRDGTTTRLTLSRPDKANAMSASLVEALIAAVHAACADGSRLLVFDGVGKHFCAGFDFTGYDQQSEGDLALRFIRIETLLQAIYHAPLQTMALAHGRNFGAGADLVAACQHRVVAPGSTFRMPGLRFGLVLGTRRLCHRIGDAAARSILSTSRAFDTQEALRLGFATEVAEQAEWPRVVEAAERDAALLSPSATASLHEASLPDTRAQDMAALAASASIPGLRERIRAFREAQASA